MRRRNVVFLLLGGGAVPLWPRAMVADRTRRIGVVMVYGAEDAAGKARAVAFTHGLEILGWVDGRNVHIEYRWPGSDPVQIRAMAEELVSLAPDAIMCTGTPAALALKQLTRTIPVVFVSADPIGQRLVESLVHPGSNMTGFALYEPSMGGKWLELLKEIAPGVIRVALIYNPDTAPFFESFVSSIDLAAPLFTIALTKHPVHDDAELARAIGSISQSPGGALLVFPDAFNLTRRKFIIEQAAHYRLPAIYYFPDFAFEGGLLSYGADAVDLHFRAASYVDRILNGEKPANLPVQHPVKYKLVVNLKTAKALGLTVGPMLLARADEVIE